jgi:hypothetical protein
MVYIHGGQLVLNALADAADLGRALLFGLRYYLRSMDSEGGSSWHLYE